MAAAGELVLPHAHGGRIALHRAGGRLRGEQHAERRAFALHYLRQTAHILPPDAAALYLENSPLAALDVVLDVDDPVNTALAALAPHLPPMPIPPPHQPEQ